MTIPFTFPSPRPGWGGARQGRLRRSPQRVRAPLRPGLVIFPYPLSAWPRSHHCLGRGTCPLQRPAPLFRKHAASSATVLLRRSTPLAGSEMSTINASPEWRGGAGQNALLRPSLRRPAPLTPRNLSRAGAVWWGPPGFPSWFPGPRPSHTGLGADLPGSAIPPAHPSPRETPSWLRE